jgi:hypothetical protein
MASDLDSLADIGIDDGGDASLGLADITSEKRSCLRDKLKLVGQTDKLRQVTINRLGENGLGYCLVKDC